MDSAYLVACSCGIAILTPRNCSTARCPKCGAVVETETGRERRRLAAVADGEDYKHRMAEVQ